METDSLPTAVIKRPKLRWYQYSLRSLFLLTLLVAIGMSYVAVTMKNQRKEKAAAVAFEKAGGYVTSEISWLGRLLRDDSLVGVTEVALTQKPVTDAGLVHLEALRHLQVLNLAGTEVTDAGLVHLEALSRLQQLLLDDTHITDAGLINLRGLSQLQRLSLNRTNITDAGLVHLQGLNQLHGLGLINTQVTDQGVKKLQQALPKCQMVLRLPESWVPPTIKPQPSRLQ